MDDEPTEPTEPTSTTLDDLLFLANTTEGARSNLEECVGLRSMVLRELDIYDEVSPGRIIALLDRVLSGVAAQARGQAIKRLDNPEIDDKYKFRPDKHPSFLTAAAGELLGYTKEETREQVRKKYYLDEEVWHERSKEYQGPLLSRRLWAGAWLGGQHPVNVRRDNKQRQLFGVFETAVKLYVAERREELRVLAIDGSQPSKSQGQARRFMRPGLPLTAVTVRHSLQQAHSAIDPKLEQVIRDLADVVHRQLLEEEQQRKVSDPIPIPVRYTAAAPHLADHAKNIFGVREDIEPAPLEGTIDDIADAFDSYRRLVVLGRGGAGKTVLVTELALALLRPECRNSPSAPVPIIFQLASWNPAEQGLQDWMIQRLIAEHEALKAKDKGKGTRAAQLVLGRHIIPILDGFDEIAPNLRAAALSKLNGSLERGQQVILTSRPGEYEAAVDDINHVFSFAAVIELKDLTLDDLTDYLPRTARPLKPEHKREVEASNATAWHPVFASIRAAKEDVHSAMLLAVLSTPLMVALARSIYSDGSGDPSELLKPEQFPDASTLSDYLFDQFIHVAYSYSFDDRPNAKSRKSWKPDDARKWLGFLATCLFAQNTRELAWWNVFGRRRGAASTFTTPLILAVVLGSGGVFLLYIGVSMATFEGRILLFLLLTLPCYFMLRANATMGAYAKPKILPHRESLFKLPSLNHLATDIYSALLFVIAMMTIMVAVPTPLKHARDGIIAPVVIPSAILILLLVVAVAAMTMRTAPHSLTETISPQLLLRRDRGAAAARAALYTCVTAILTSVWTEEWTVKVPLVFLAAAGTLLLSASGSWFIRNVTFVAVGLLPPSCMSFLDDAHRRGVLRQVGGVYHFKHALLQDRLAVKFIDNSSGLIKARRTILDARAPLALSRFMSGSFDAADIELRDILKELHHAGNRNSTLLAWHALIQVLKRQGKLAEALREARLFCDKAAPSGRIWMSNAYYHGRVLVAELLVDQGNITEATGEYSALLKLLEERMVKLDAFSEPVATWLDLLSYDGSDRLVADVENLLAEVQSRIPVKDET